MSYRVAVTKITLEYFLVDVDDQEMENPQSESQARIIARAKVGANPAPHKLGSEDTTMVVTSTQEF